MLKHPDLTRRRIESFIANTLRPRLWQTQISLEAAVYHAIHSEPRRDYRQMRIAPQEP